MSPLFLTIVPQFVLLEHTEPTPVCNGRERGREKEKGRQAGRQTDRQRQTDRLSQTDRDRETKRQRERDSASQ